LLLIGGMLDQYLLYSFFCFLLPTDCSIGWQQESKKKLHKRCQSVKQPICTSCEASSCFVLLPTNPRTAWNEMAPPALPTFLHIFFLFSFHSNQGKHLMTSAGAPSVASYMPLGHKLQQNGL